MKTGNWFVAGLLVLMLGVSACEGFGTGSRSRTTPSAAPDDGQLSRIEARLIGLTDEVNRLGRRVSRLEGNPVPEPPLRQPPVDRTPVRPPPDLPPLEPESKPVPDLPPDPTPKAPEDRPDLDSVIDRMRAEAPKSWTGIFIDVRPLAADAPEGRNYPTWEVTDPDGEVIISDSNLPSELRGKHPVFWVAPAGTALGPEALPVLGTSPFEAIASSAKQLSEVAVRIGLSAEDAETLRSIKDLGRLLRAGNITIMMLKREE